MMANKRDSFSIIHKYADVKTQKISPEGKAKIQLQVVLHDGNSTTFQFIHPEGNLSLSSSEHVKDNLAKNVVVISPVILVLLQFLYEKPLTRYVPVQLLVLV